MISPVRPLRRVAGRPGWWMTACGRLAIRRSTGAAGYHISPARARWWGLMHLTDDLADLERQPLPRLRDAVRVAEAVLTEADARVQDVTPLTVRRPTRQERTLFDVNDCDWISDTIISVFAYRRKPSGWLVTRHSAGTVGGRAGIPVSGALVRTLTQARRIAACYDAVEQIFAYRISEARDRAAQRARERS